MLGIVNIGANIVMSKVNCLNIVYWYKLVIYVNMPVVVSL